MRERLYYTHYPLTQEGIQRILVQVVGAASEGRTFDPKLISTVSLTQRPEDWRLIHVAAQEVQGSSRFQGDRKDYGSSVIELIDLMVERAEAALYRSQVHGLDGYHPDLIDFVATLCSSLPSAVDDSNSLKDPKTSTFLETLNQYWTEERKFRWTTNWSPMPWSSVSRGEQAIPLLEGKSSHPQ